MWGHSYEFFDNDNWQVIENLAAYAGGRDDVWFATTGEICDYVEAYDRLRFGANGDFVYNPSAINVYLNYYDKQYVVLPEERLNLNNSSGFDCNEEIIN